MSTSFKPIKTDESLEEFKDVISQVVGKSIERFLKIKMNKALVFDEIVHLIESTKKDTFTGDQNVETFLKVEESTASSDVVEQKDREILALKNHIERLNAVIDTMKNKPNVKLVIEEVGTDSDKKESDVESEAIEESEVEEEVEVDDEVGNSDVDNDVDAGQPDDDFFVDEDEDEDEPDDITPEDTRKMLMSRILISKLNACEPDEQDIDGNFDADTEVDDTDAEEHADEDEDEELEVDDTDAELEVDDTDVEEHEDADEEDEETSVVIKENKKLDETDAEENDNDSEIEEELYEIEIDGITYYTNDEDLENGDIFEALDDDVGEIIGTVRNGEIEFDDESLN